MNLRADAAAAADDDDTGCCILKLQFGELHASVLSGEEEIKGVINHSL
jgi:hypothetical protein